MQAAITASAQPSIGSVTSQIGPVQFSRGSLLSALQANTASGAKVRHTAPSRLSAVLAYLPELPAQCRIAAILGAMLKFDGKFILQTKTDGPVDMIVADYVAPGKVRGYARFDADRMAALKNPTQVELLGKGYLAMTVDQGPDMERYQGIVPLDGADLTAAAHSYFEKSEQIPTRIRMAAGPLLRVGEVVESRRCARPRAQGALASSRHPRNSRPFAGSMASGLISMALISVCGRVRSCKSCCSSALT